jgi:hypothetical protein
VVEKTLSVVLALWAGIAVQAVSTAWVSSVSSRKIFRSSLLSMTYAACLVVGVGRSSGSIVEAAAYVIGCGVGSAVAVRRLSTR